MTTGIALGPIKDGGRQVVAWCAGCCWYVEATEAGENCPGLDCKRRLRKRVGFICRICELHPIFFTIAEYRAHLDEHRKEDA